MVSAQIPPELLEYWNSDAIRNTFSIDFQTTKYVATEDTLATYIKNKYHNSTFTAYGLPEEQTVIKNKHQFVNLTNLKVATNMYDAYVSIKFLHNNKVKVGDTVAATSQKDIYQYHLADVTWGSINADDWFYENDDINLSSENDNLHWMINKAKLIPLTETKLDRYSYGYFRNNNQRVGIGTSWYIDANGELQKYYALDNVVLRMKKTALPSAWSFNSKVYCVFSEKSGVVASDDTYLYIRPYSWTYFSGLAQPKTGSELITNMMSVGTPVTWMDAATTYRDSVTNSYFIAVNTVQVPVKYHITGEVKVYDESALYTKQQFVNQILDVASSQFYNAKFSRDTKFSDAFLKIGLTIPDGNSSMIGLKKLSTQIDSSNFVGKKLVVFETLYLFAIKIIVVFIVLILALIIMSISMVSQLFIEQFYQTIMLFKTMGYKNSEIHKLILGIYLPVNLVFIMMGAFVPTILAYIATIVISNHGFVILQTFIYLVPIATIIILTAIFIAIYFWSYKVFISKAIQEQSTK